MLPSVLSHWLAQDGSLVVSENTLKSMEWPYNKPNPAFQDINLRNNVWPELESFLPAAEWKQMVLTIASKSRERILTDSPRTQLLLSAPLLHLLSMHAVIVCTEKMLKEA